MEFGWPTRATNSGGQLGRAAKVAHGGHKVPIGDLTNGGCEKDFLKNLLTNPLKHPLENPLNNFLKNPLKTCLKNPLNGGLKVAMVVSRWPMVASRWPMVTPRLPMVASWLQGGQW